MKTAMCPTAAKQLSAGGVLKLTMLYGWASIVEIYREHVPSQVRIFWLKWCSKNSFQNLWRRNEVDQSSPMP